MKFTLENGRTNQIGSVSCDTLRNEDLIPKFLDEAIYCGINVDDESAEWANLVSNSETDSEDAAYLLDELVTKLNEIAPEGFYFGTTMGDGADFGWWSEPDEDF